jgi:hypothetical protein
MMSTPLPSSASIREYVLENLNHALRRPGMFRGETGLVLYLDIVGFAFGNSNILRRFQDKRHAQKAFDPHDGVSGAFRRLWAAADDHMVASIYAEEARLQGWLRPGRWLQEAEYNRIAGMIDSWCASDRTLAASADELGLPSLCSGPTTGRWPVTLIFATENLADPMISFYFWNELKSAGRWLYDQPVLLGARREAASFPSSFTLTPTGRRMQGAARGPNARDNDVTARDQPT